MSNEKSVFFGIDIPLFRFDLNPWIMIAVFWTEAHGRWSALWWQPGRLPAGDQSSSRFLDTIGVSLTCAASSCPPGWTWLHSSRPDRWRVFHQCELVNGCRAYRWRYGSCCRILREVRLVRRETQCNPLCSYHGLRVESERLYGEIHCNFERFFWNFGYFSPKLGHFDPQIGTCTNKISLFSLLTFF